MNVIGASEANGILRMIQLKEDEASMFSRHGIPDAPVRDTRRFSHARTMFRSVELPGLHLSVT